MRTLLVSMIFAAALGCGGKQDPAAATPPGPAPASGCMPVPWLDDSNAGEATYRGTLAVIDAEHPNGSVERPYIVTLEAPACLPAGGAEKATAQIQIFSSDEGVQKQIAALVGSAVVVTGDGFVAQTAHHHRPIVVEAKSVAAK